MYDLSTMIIIKVLLSEQKKTKTELSEQLSELQHKQSQLKIYENNLYHNCIGWIEHHL
jgi:septal ring factor EnvC (AmiA/AmiB activator)